MHLQPYLDRLGVPYKMLHQDRTLTAQELAHTEHVSGHKVIKPVLVQVDGQFVLCALPALARIDLNELRRQLDADEIKLADEITLQQVFANCEVGAEPPIGAIFGLPTVMDDSLTEQDWVTFQSGSHGEAVTIALTDYQRIAQPGIAHFARRLA